MNLIFADGKDSCLCDQTVPLYTPSAFEKPQAPQETSPLPFFIMNTFTVDDTIHHTEYFFIL
jgi:hypothetical protein